MRTELLQHEIVVESMGGDTLDVEVSAVKGTNLDKLLETILLQAEVLDLKANPDREASGMVVEAQLDKGRGPGRHRSRPARHLEAWRHLRGRLGLGPRARARQRQGRTGQGGWAFGAGRGARSRIRRRKPATRSTSSKNEARAREITDYREQQAPRARAARLRRALRSSR